MQIFNEVDKSFFENIWHHITQFFSWLGDQIEGLFTTLGIDFNAFVISIYNEYIANIPTIFKILGLLFISILLILGIIQFIKKSFKLFLVLLIIFLIIVLVNHFMN